VPTMLASRKPATIIAAFESGVPRRLSVTTMPPAQTGAQ